MNSEKKTIVAIATPPGRGGIAVIRLSGPKALEIALRICHIDSLEPRRATFCHFFLTRVPDPDIPTSPQTWYIDNGLVTYFPAPHSYTGEDVVEMSCHGSEFVQKTLLLECYFNEAHMAEPGEFTMRAFSNGKLDLSQAEAVADLIDAITPAQHELAISQLRGSYAQELKLLRQQLVDISSLFELELDFSQEDVEFVDRTQLTNLITEIKQQSDELANSFASGQALRDGIPVAIVGPPNAGKSSLLNRLIGDDRAIVSPIEGTTRDTVEDTLYIDSRLFRIIDTAGLRSTDDPIEVLGIERSHRAIEQARIILYVHDATLPFEMPTDMIPPDPQKMLVVVHNKCDLLTEKPPIRKDGQLIPSDGSVPQCYFSALTGEGLYDLRMTLYLFANGFESRHYQNIVSNPRHYEALKQVSKALQYALDALAQGLTTDLVAVDLRDALYHMGTITGEVVNDEVLGNIFSRFCIGK